MAVYKILFNKKRCISCYACMVHCKVKNNVPEGVSLNWLRAAGPFSERRGLPSMDVTYQPCEQCTTPKCVAVCPCDALYIREKDNLIAYDSDACCGCGNCVSACPWQVPVLHPDTGKIIKCDYCCDRIEEGKEPACVTGCTAKALSFVRL